MKLFTIGFTEKPAQEFFGALKKAGAKTVVDVRLNNDSHISGFARQKHLVYFLKDICGIGYVHLPELAPTEAMFDEYKKRKGDWNTYERRFLDLMEKRRIEDKVSKEVIAGGCLLCSEDKPHHCHRRLVAEYLKRHWGNIEISHLG